jgi:hypothetical protein
MLMLKNKIAIYELLFKGWSDGSQEGCPMPKHPELVDKNVPTLPITKAMHYLKS